MPEYVVQQATNLRNIVGASSPSQRAPSHGGHVTVAHQRLMMRGAPAAVVAQLPAKGAAVALSLLSKGATADHALRSAGYRAGASGVHITGGPSSMGDEIKMSGDHRHLREVGLGSNGPRTFPMGFGLTPVAAGANVVINANPQVNFRPDRLIVPDSIAPSFMINDFKIGMRSQLVAPGALPAQSFTQEAIDTCMLLDTVNVGQFVTLDVTNVSTQTVNFAATLFGKTLNS